MSVPAHAPSAWSWEGLDTEHHDPFMSTDYKPPGTFAEEEPKAEPEPHPEEHTEDTGPAPRQRYYASRTCRICLEEVSPTYEPLTGGIPSILHPAPKVKYVSSDPSSGRLIRPCKCRGSQKYVHEGCLQAWRHSDSAYGARTFWECPTCKFKYRLERMRWSRLITSTLTQIVITFAIMLATVFLFGFVADPIINLYLDPYETITSIPSGGTQLLLEDEDASWIEHFLKGLASLGLLGFVKVFFAMSPWHWWNLRQTGILGGRRRGGTGRDRLEDISWTVVVIGVVTFLAAVWTWVRSWTKSTLEKAGDRVADVQGDEDDDEQLDEPTPAQAADGSCTTPGNPQSQETPTSTSAEDRKTQ
ncbi:related to RING finger domain protein [Phialocephala subalpina]|uniref:Related to RING finger domain protein n=1 Tax=Phialocephala subalpina TaxID=576137 RepID=A0A1L7WJQ2_9HELO|nr:related to RING finger domain protein [Phialocephala subalpina]